MIHPDLMGHHVTYVRRDALETRVSVESAVGDARALDLPDASVDAMLLLGPLYHLNEREDRLAALCEAARVLRPGGAAFVAAISRWVTRLDGVVRLRAYREFPEVREMIDEVERTGIGPPLYEGSFTAYSHTPDELRDEVMAAGLDVEDLVCVEGIAFALLDLQERLADPLDREVLMETSRAHDRVPELLGLGPHFIATGRRPSARTTPTR